MCGIVGILDSAVQFTRSDLEEQVRRMARTLRHRGPDSDGVWSSGDAGVAFGHRRLAILDLSPQGAQPMVSASGRYVVTFNGEIYNFRELRANLEKHRHRFRGCSDTEVLLTSFDQWGIPEAIRRFNGMFAFGVWDRERRELHLARDRIGEKPLYYTWLGRRLLFASELRAFFAHDGFRPEISRPALGAFLRYTCVPGSLCIYEGVHKVQPGHHLVFRAEARAEPEVDAYWSAEEVIQRALNEPPPASREEAIAELQELLVDAVRMRLESDVPLGAFLSGGIDSSTVVSVMQAQLPRPVKTFTIGFAEERFDEARYARAVARHLGTDHHELQVTPAMTLAAIPRQPLVYDEPFADSSQIPTLIVSEHARQQVTVTLSGDGGDELFGGYSRYGRARFVWRWLSAAPAWSRHVAETVLRRTPPERWERVCRVLERASAGRASWLSVDRIGKLAAVVASPTPEQLYEQVMSQWARTSDVVIGLDGEDPGAGAFRSSPSCDFTQRLMYHDLVNYLPDDILVKVDRATMSHSLESRIPLLDHRIVELAWRLPIHWNVQGGTGKAVLRDLLHRYVPAELVDHPKHGFGVPIGEWLRGPLRDWAEDLLREDDLRQAGYLEPVAVRSKWSAHLDGRGHWQAQLWAVLMFQGWLDAQRSGHGTPEPSSVRLLGNGASGSEAAAGTTVAPSSSAARSQ